MAGQPQHAPLHLDERLPGSPRHLAYFRTLTLTALLAAISIAATSWTGGIAAIWLVNPVLLALLLRAPQARWGNHLLVAGVTIALVNLALGVDSVLSVGMALVNVGEALLAAALIQRFIGQVPRLHVARDLVVTVLVAVLLVPLLGGLMAAIEQRLIEQIDFLKAWISWFASSALGMAVLLPIVLAARARDVMERLARPYAELALGTVLVAGTAILIFANHGLPILFAVYPVLVLATLRLGWVGAALGQVVVTVVASQATMFGQGPIALHVRTGTTDQVLFLQAYLATLALTIMPLGAALAARRRAQQEEARARAAANAASLAKSRFLANMSHELRTPLNAVLGFAQLMQLDHERPLHPIHNDYVGYILEQGNHLLKLISEVLEMARIDAGALNLKLEPVDVRKLLAEFERVVRPMAEERSLELRIVYPFAPLFVTADHSRLLQVLVNFGSNAVRYNRAGGRVVVEQRRLDNGHIRISVADTGFGISPEAQRQMFDPFNRLEKDQGELGGTGVGLAIAKQLADMMGAVIGLDSRENEGTTIWIDLPQAERPALTPVATTAVRPPSLPQPGAATILYVEESPASSALMHGLFADQPELKLISATTGALGLAAAKRHKPDLVITDMHLPDMTGATLLERLRDDPATRLVPVVALCTAEDLAVLPEGEQPFDAYLAKPVMVAQLLQTLRALLDRTQGRSARA